MTCHKMCMLHLVYFEIFNNIRYIFKVFIEEKMITNLCFVQLTQLFTFCDENCIPFQFSFDILEISLRYKRQWCLVYTSCRLKLYLFFSCSYIAYHIVKLTNNTTIIKSFMMYSQLNEKYFGLRYALGNLFKVLWMLEIYN